MPANFARFHHEGCGIRDIVQFWLARAENTHDDFDRFYYLWSAFNSWALIVTLKDSDAAMVNTIADDPEVQRFYDRVVVSDAVVMDALRGTQGSFPLQSFADLVRIDQSYDWRSNQGSDDYNRRIANSGRRVKVSPPLNPHTVSSVLKCLYAVRCNLIHGSKMATRQERDFVYVFSTVLVRLLLDRQSLLTLQ